MKKVEILSKTGREGRYTAAYILELKDNKIYYKPLSDGTYKVVAKWGVGNVKTEIIITSMTPTAKAMIKDSLLLNFCGHKQKVFWVEDNAL